MALTDPDYNAFATSVVGRFARRLRGLDPTAERLVGIRPQDHILAGFLTPVETTDAPDGGNVDVDAALASDLPRDSTYEQTSVGAEWLMPVNQASGELQVSITGSVYVRRIPQWEEQVRTGVWQTITDPVAGPRRMSELVPVWTREPFEAIGASVALEELFKKGRLRVDLGPALADRLRNADISKLFPGRRPVWVDETQVADAAAYRAFLATMPPTGLSLGWRIVLDLRLVPFPNDPTLVRVAARVINQTPPISRVALDYVDANVYAVTFDVEIPKVAHRNTIFGQLPASFRFNREMPGVGINGHVEATISTNTIALSLQTVPIAAVPRLEPRDIPAANPTFDSLIGDPISVLSGIRDAMNRYDAESWNKRIRNLSGQEEIEANDARKRFRAEIERFEQGIALLADLRFPAVRRAFELMNRAMKASATKFDAWRLFQIVFIVSQLRELAAREYTELATPEDGYVEILWFAAGGGKTEAFLGVIVWQAFFDRLRGKRVGTSALVRFPLRLLTFQQLQRLSRVLGQAEVIRASERLGGARFSVGYFVGSTVTPNSISDEDHRRFESEGVDARWQRVFACPFCGSKAAVAYAAPLRLIEHRCISASCPGGPGRLPVYIVDDDLYRFLPSVIVSTVDKLAQLGQNQRFANLFGRVDAICREHGATFQKTNRLCPAATEIAAGKRPITCGQAPIDYGPFHDAAPALLIQDELHLLSEELGTFDSHYETATMQFAASLGAKPWKIIAATATIEEYAQHAWQLYLRKARQFPGPGPEAYDSFYYQQNRERLGRIFVGVLGVGRKHTPSVTRALTMFYLELQSARDWARSDLDAASTAYVGRTLTTAEFRRLVFLYELALTYVLTRKGSDQVAEAIESRVKREVLDAAPLHGELLVDMFNGGVDVTDMIGAMEEIAQSDDAGDPATRIRGLVTTNIIGHGVDVDRFNVMVFAGFTRLVAEYIQASARVGRTFPGLSILVVTPQSERDRSIFDRFGKFHEYLDRLVDPSAVNRWPEPAVLRTIPGVLAGYLMGVAAFRVGRQLATVENVLDRLGEQGAEALNEEEIVDWLLAAYGASKAPTPKYGERLSVRARNAISTVINTPRSQGKPRPLNTYLGAMRSLRDVDDPATIEVNDDRDARILQAFTNG
ncbi:MAG TPA: DEAD/DEAH box helicase family protein [Vicinamibacterales bacterium]|nr:DEAD/DEAH box helicase family protein [Vicinamibacterales bacterium]